MHHNSVRRMTTSETSCGQWLTVGKAESLEKCTVDKKTYNEIHTHLEKKTLSEACTELKLSKEKHWGNFGSFGIV